MSQQKQILNFDGLYGDDIRNYSAEYIFLELISTRSKTFDWNIKPHIHTQLYQVFIVKNGSLVFQEATKQQEIHSPCIIFIPPTKLHGLVYSVDTEGLILSLSSTIIEDIFKTSNLVWSSFEDIRIINEFESILSFGKIEQILSDINEELFNDHSERFMMLKAYITQFFVHLHRLSRQVEEQSGHSLKIDYFRKFQQKIKSSNSQKSIPEYAAELNITAVHLNRICKGVVGKSAIELVHQNLISEAQKYLIHTSYSISEIAYQLHFEYPNYFAKLFKKHVGCSPNEYRKIDRK